MESNRRNVLAAGAAAAAAAAPKAAAQQTRLPGTTKFYEQGTVKHRLSGSRHGVSAAADRGRRIELDAWRAWSQPVQSDRGVQQRVPLHLRGSAQRLPRQSSGPLEIDRPWDSYTDDHSA